MVEEYGNLLSILNKNIIPKEEYNDTTQHVIAYCEIRNCLFVANNRSILVITSDETFNIKSCFIKTSLDINFDISGNN